MCSRKSRKTFDAGLPREPHLPSFVRSQVIALLGTWLSTVAMGLLAFDLAGGSAEAVLGMALAIKMVAYEGDATVASAFAERIPSGPLLVTLNLFRAGPRALPALRQRDLADLRRDFRAAGGIRLHPHQSITTLPELPDFIASKPEM
jgi:hypothetical protein